MNSRMCVIFAIAGVMGYAALAFLSEYQAVQHSSLILIALQCSLLLASLIYLLRSNLQWRPPPLFEGYVFWIIFGSLLLLFLGWEFRQTFFASDESAYLFQARLFDAGVVTTTAPPAQEMSASNPYFYQHFIMSNGRWFGKYPPGFPAFLAIFVRLGAIWAANIVLGFILFAITLLIARRVNAGIGATSFLFLGSPYFVFNCLGLFSHVLAAVLTAICIFILCREDCRRSSSVLLGIVLALLLLVRPFTGALIASFVFVRVARRSVLDAILIGVLCSLGIAGTLVYNKMLTGDPFLSPYALYRGGRGIAELSVAPTALITNLISLTRWGLQETVLATVPFLMVLALLPLREKHLRSHAFNLGGPFLFLVLGHILQTENSYSSFGERYYFEGFSGLAVLAALGWRCLTARIPTAEKSWLIPVLFVLQTVLFAAFYHRAIALRFTSQAVVRALFRENEGNSVIFLGTASDFDPRTVNLNPPDWHKAAHVNFSDPDTDGARDRIVCELHRAGWARIIPNGLGSVERIPSSGLQKPNCIP